MNKKMLLGAATALSMVVGSTAALAGPSDKVVYGIGIGPYSANVAINTSTPAGQAIVNAPWIGTDALRSYLPADLQGARYEQDSTVAGNTDGNQTSVTAKFTLNGSVSKDCSFYAGDATTDTSGAFNQTINLGTIGIQTGNNVNSTLAFDQVGPINANINTSTAGCNTNNTVTVAKLNGSAGLLNSAPGSYDSNQFTDRIPYTIQANWTGIGSGVGAGTPQNITVALNDDWENKSQGAWRSSFDLAITAPAPTKGLVAGNYSDAVIVSLAAW